MATVETEAVPHGLNLFNSSHLDDVYVYYGTFGERGSYRLFQGGSRALETVYYRDQCLYPVKDEQEELPRCIMVETFLSPSQYSVSVIVLLRYMDRIQFKERLNYVLLDGGLVPFESSGAVPYPAIVRIGLDIRPRALVHPFILKTVETRGNDDFIEYKLKAQFAKRDINPPLFPMVKVYIIGTVYDSSRKIMFGYSLFWYFTDHALSVTLITRKRRSILYIKEMRKVTLRFATRRRLSFDVWEFCTDGTKPINDEQQMKAVTTAETLEPFTQHFKIMADVARIITPEMQHILVAAGQHKDWKYFYYEVDRTKIQGVWVEAIIDTSIGNFVIWSQPEEPRDVYIEIYENKNLQERYVVLTTTRVGSLYEREKHIFKRVWDGERYIYGELVDAEFLIERSTLKQLSPIQLDLDLSIERLPSIIRKTAILKEVDAILYDVWRPDPNPVSSNGKYTLKYIYESFPYFPNAMIHNQYRLPYIHEISKDIDSPCFIAFNSALTDGDYLSSYIAENRPDDLLVQRLPCADFYYKEDDGWEES